MSNDRRDAALRERLRIVGKATPGSWSLQDRGAIPLVYGPNGERIAKAIDNREDTAHVAANSPDVVRADIEEILRLRAENESLNKEANWLAKALGVQVRDGFGCAWCWLSESDMCNGDYTESLRNAASEAVEEEENV